MESDTLTVSVVSRGADPVRLPFFGGIDIDRVGVPDRTDDNVIWVVEASVRDVLIRHTQAWDRTVPAVSKADRATLRPS